MRVGQGVLLLVLSSVNACRDRDPAPAASGGSSSSSGSGSSAAVAPAIPPPPPIAAAAAPADAPLDTAAPDAPAKLTISNQLPSLGCLGWSPARGLAACIVGHTGYNVGDVEVKLVFVDLIGSAAEPPPPLTLAAYDQGSAYRLSEELSPELTRQLTTALADVVPWTASARIETRYVDDKPVLSPPIEVAGMSIGARLSPGPGGAMTQLYVAELTVRGAKRARLLDETIEYISSLRVDAFTVPGRAGHRVVLLEVGHGIGDEGVTGSTSSLRRCTATACTTPEL